MSTINGHWSRDKCIVGDCPEPPTDEHETCAVHAVNVHVSTYASYLDAEAPS